MVFSSLGVPTLFGLKACVTPHRGVRLVAARHIAALMAVVGSGALLPVLAQTSRNAPRPAASAPATPTPPSPARLATPSAPAADSPNLLAQAALQQGARQCAGRIHQVSQFLGYQAANTGALLMPGAGPADRALLGISLELPTADSVGYVTSVFVPDPANGCIGSYDAVVYWPRICSEVASQVFGGARPVGALQQRIQMLEVGPSSRIFLMPAGAQGCVSIKRELIQP